MALLGAHPPEFHRKGMKVSTASTLAASKQASEESDRQFAYFQFEFLTALAIECPTSVQPDVINQALAEFHFATVAPQALPIEKLLERRVSLHTKIRELHSVIRCSWKVQGVSPLDPLPPIGEVASPIGVATGLSRCVILEVENKDTVAVNLSVLVDNQPQNSVPWTVLPSKVQFFLLTLNTDKPNAKIELKSNGISHEFPLAIQQLAPARIRVKLMDADLNLPTAARVWVEGSDHQYRHAGPFAANRSFTEKPLLLFTAPRTYRVPFFYAEGSFEMEVPPGPTVVTLERGFEHRLEHLAVDLVAGETRDLSLSSGRFVDMKKAGWISGDTHIHWVTNAWNVDLPIDDLAWVQRAEDLRVANNLTLLHRTNVDAFIKPSQAPVGPIQRLCDENYHIEMAEEYRNQNLYGHLCF